jgi:hypothetical protein
MRIKKNEDGLKSKYLQLKDIKLILKNNGINKNLVSIKYIIHDIFPDVIFYNRKIVDKKDLLSVFHI